MDFTSAIIGSPLAAARGRAAGGPWAIVPVKRFDRAKLRLSGLLGDAERAELARTMLGDVLLALRSVETLAGILVVTSDQAAARLAADLGAEVAPDPAEPGIDAAIGAGLRALAGRASAVIVVPGDVPQLVAADLRMVIAHLAAPAVVAVPASRDGGTNLLAAAPAALLTPRFGPDSFARHVAAARAAGVEPCVPELASLGLDLDRPDDLAAFLALRSATRTHDYLAGLGIGTACRRPARGRPSRGCSVMPIAPRLDAFPDDRRLTRDEALALAGVGDLGALLRAAAGRRDRAHGRFVSYSRKVFIPLTQLCRDVCHYCTFAHPPRRGEAAYLSVAQVLDIARAGQAAGCREALFTLGDKPELRYRAARDELARLGHATTISYLAEAAKAVFAETGLFPHVNPGLLEANDIAALREVSISQGIMLESASERLCRRGGPHFGSPDKRPAARLRTIELAGEQAVPFTSGILIGIGETRAERIDALLALRDLNDRFGHIQEIIVQNFRPKPGTRMADIEAPSLDEHLWTIAVARLLFEPSMNIQAPPNLTVEGRADLIAAGINDWGGVSPVTPDHVNPEAPWPHLKVLEAQTRAAGKELVERLAIYPAHARHPSRFVDQRLRTAMLKAVDGDGWPRPAGDWSPGSVDAPPRRDAELLRRARPKAQGDIAAILDRAQGGERLGEGDVVALFRARDDDFAAVCAAADALRRKVNGDTVSYVVTRNINYTNICYFKCQFCAFSKGKMSENLRGRPYDLPLTEVQDRVREAWDRGATEVCMQGGIHPAYTGAHYLAVCRAVKEAAPGMHVHAFSPLEVHQGAQTLGLPLDVFLGELKEAGLGTLPGTAAEILDDEVRAIICPDKIGTQRWLDVMRAAHGLGLRTTATIMFGHVERYEHWARHLLRLRDLQAETGGFTEFVPLPFVHMEAPIYLKGRARKGPTFREAMLMHAVARLTLHPLITNIQASWVKLGPEGVRLALDAGVNDLGGTLMNETISRSAGASHGQEMTPDAMEAIIRAAGRVPRQRTTLYGDAPTERRLTAFAAPPMAEPVLVEA